MKFEIRAVYEENYEEVIKPYPQLNGYKIEKIVIPDSWRTKMMINIDSLEELEKLGKELNQELIINMKDKVIIIYDDYIE